MKAALVVLCLLITGAEAKAELTVKELRKIISSNVEQGQLFAKMYIGGGGDALSWANTMLRISGKPQLYCVPEKLPLTIDDYFNIYNRGLDDAQKKLPADQLESSSVNMVLVITLQETFPCQAEKPKTPTQ